MTKQNSEHYQKYKEYYKKYKKEHVKESYQRDKEYHKEYCQKNKDRIKAYRFKYNREHVYGLAIEDYNKLLVLQRGTCAICGCTPTSKALSVDHDHVTGKVRGLLCYKCNSILGFSSDNINILTKSIEYLKDKK